MDKDIHHHAPPRPSQHPRHPLAHLACYRYIELNPVRANMVAHPRDYR